MKWNDFVLSVMHMPKIRDEEVPAHNCKRTVSTKYTHSIFLADGSATKQSPLLASYLEFLPQNICDSNGNYEHP